MKKISLSILIATLILSLGLGTVYAATTSAIVVANTALSTGDLIITATSLARQTATITFTTSVNVYLAAMGSAATASENYIVSGAHLNGDKAYAIANIGGGVRWLAKTAATATFTAPTSISVAGVVDWGNYAAM